MARARLTLADLGEDRFVSSLFPHLPNQEELRVGPGDDCAVVVPPSGGRLLLLKTDCVVEGHHFTSDASPARVGRKAICRALSDMAAMGGIPRHALVTILSPPDIPASYWHDVYRGLARAAENHGVAVAGGETSSAPLRALSVCLTGEIESAHLKTRSGARPGDALLVTGRLGGALAGKHFSFRPRLAEGQWLSKRRHVTAMMDLSDGLAADLPRLARASGCGFQISSLPCNRGCSAQSALNDGEDYELLIAVRAENEARLRRDWRRQFPKLSLSPIGHLTGPDEPGHEMNGGFDHFTQNAG